MKTAQADGIGKTQEDVDKIMKMSMSASSLKNYLVCPAKFYYSSVMRLKLEEEVAESLDAAMIGTIFHAVMFDIYAAAYDGPISTTDDGKFWIGMLDVPYKVSRQHMKAWFDNELEIRRKVMDMIAQTMKTDEVSGRNLVIADVIVRYVQQTLDRDIAYLDENSTDSLLIYGLEVPLDTRLSGQKIKGLVDRVDAVREGEIRVVDYKTGKVLADDYEIDDNTYQRIAESIFAEDVAERPGIAFQFYIYDLLLRNKGYDAGRQMKNSIYSMATIFKEEPQTRNLHEGFYSMMTQSLEGLLDQMYDLQVPFRRTQEQSCCAYCDFRNICGK
jgi:CRISPR/Cas system-associated exonuclease Cas4 (RecB family)